MQRQLLGVRRRRRARVAHAAVVAGPVVIVASTEATVRTVVGVLAGQAIAAVVEAPARRLTGAGDEDGTEDDRGRETKEASSGHGIPLGDPAVQVGCRENGLIRQGGKPAE